MRASIDGAFDLVHNDYNAIRKASLLCDVLETGFNSDEGIAEVKGSTILNHEERCFIKESCKYVSQVAPNMLYNGEESILDSFSCHYYAHDDDSCIGSDGTDICETLLKMGRFK